MNSAIVLAAGKGVRMKSDLPKVFHKILGKPVLSYVLDAVEGFGFDRVYLIVGHKANVIRDYYQSEDVIFVEQKERLGTGHAVMQVGPQLKDVDGTTVVLAGDMPLISSQTINELVAFHKKMNAKATVLTAMAKEPFGYGRIVRDESGQIVKIAEEKDANPDEKKIDEINTGIYCFDNRTLFLALKELKPENAQKEYYLTDTIRILKEKGLPVFAHLCERPLEAMGINTQDELRAVEKIISSEEHPAESRA